MASDKGPLPGKVPLSSKIMGLKFMQRAQEKVRRETAAEETAQRDIDAHWVVEGAQSRCIVVTEGDPLPSATVGRMSFRGFNPATERLAPEALKGTAAGAAEAEAGDGGGVSVSDADMAAHVAPRNQQQQEQQINSGGKRKGQHGEPEANGAGTEEQQHQQQQQRGGRPGHSGGRGGGGGHKRQRYF